MPPTTSLSTKALLLTFLAVLAATGCTPAGDAPVPTTADTTVTDALGREVRFEKPVRRVVTLAPNLTEIVFAAGAGGKLVGVTTADDYPPAVDTLARFNALPVDFEAVTALRPDLILATDQVNTPRDADTFAALDLPIYFFSFSSLKDVLTGIRTAGRLLGTSAEAGAASDSLRRVIDRLRTRTASVDNRPLVLFLIGAETLYAFGSGSYIHTLIRLAGGRSATAHLDAKAPILSEEFVLEKAPEVIIGPFGEDFTAEDLLALHPAWDVVPAIRSGRIYSVPADLVLRPGPRLVKGARLMAKKLHPELFGSWYDK